MKQCLTFTALALAVMAAVPGCYDSSTDSHDAITDSETAPDPGLDLELDPAEDPTEDLPMDWDCDESTLAVDDVVYSRVVFPMTPIELVVFHELALGVRLDVGPTTSENVIEIEVFGYPMIGPCQCNDGMWCGPDGDLGRVSRHTLDGLPEGEYILRINGRDYPLLVAGPECLTYPTTIGNVEYNDYMYEVERYNIFEIESFGHSCDCGGDTNVELRISEETPEAWIDVTEVVCRPEQCCDTCECIDAFQDTVVVWIDTSSHYRYTVHINGNDYEITIFHPME
jgi:hypothetical protein